MSQGLDYDDESEVEEESEYASQSEEDADASKIKKYVSMTQEQLDNKLVHLTAQKQSIEETSTMKHTKILKQAETELVKQLYAPAEDEVVVEQPIMKDNGKGKMIDSGMTKLVVQRNLTKMNELKAKEEEMKKKLRKVNEAFTKVLEMDDLAMVQVLYDIAEHQLNKSVHYKNEMQAIDDEKELVERAIEEKDRLIVERRKQKRAQKLERKLESKHTGESSSTKKRKPARAESVFSVGAMESSSSKKSRKSK